MCNPVAIMMVASMAMQANASYQQSKYEAGVERYNARQSENEATRTRNAGVEAENAHREKVAHLISRQRAQSAASGVDINSGSALALQEDSATLGEADALRIRQNYADQAQVLDDSAALGLNRSSAIRTMGKNRLMADGVSILAQGASQVSGNWYTSDSAAAGSSQAGYTGSDYQNWVRNQRGI